MLVPAAFLLAQAGSPSGLQITPDGKRTLINKDVGDERWAITLNAADGSVTGNVFFPGGGEPVFLWCQTTGSSDGERSFACQGADRCPLAPCPPNEWAFIADVTLPESFFLPRPEEAQQSSLPGRALGSSAGSPSGLQITPDETRTLISKDVGGERWAITLNPEDGTVTGNVFFPGGGEPAFLWCEQTGADGGNLSFACQGADRCTSSSCSPDLWAFIGDVTLPASFFAPPVPLSAAQRAFADARGLPELFAITFATETLDASGRRIPLATPRRIESWIYNRDQLVAALFDNGFFVREDVLGPGAPLAPTSLNPAWFQPGMTRADVEAVLGSPSCEESLTFGGEQLTALRYRATASEPVRSVTLADGEIASVVAGFAIRGDDGSITDPCS